MIRISRMALIVICEGIRFHIQRLIAFVLERPNSDEIALECLQSVVLSNRKPFDGRNGALILREIDASLLQERLIHRLRLEVLGDEKTDHVRNHQGNEDLVVLSQLKNHEN